MVENAETVAPVVEGGQADNPAVEAPQEQAAEAAQTQPDATPTIPEGYIPEDEAKRRESAVAAAARKKAEADLEALKTEWGPLVEQAKQADEQRKKAEREAMSAEQRFAADLAERDAEVERLKLEAQKALAANQTLITHQRTRELEAIMSKAAPDLPPFYRDRLAGLAAAEDYSPDTAAETIRGWQSEWADYLGNLGLKPAPTSVGSAASPPAPPREDTTSDIEALEAEAAADTYGTTGARAKLQQLLKRA